MNRRIVSSLFLALTACARSGSRRRFPGPERYRTVVDAPSDPRGRRGWFPGAAGLSRECLRRRARGAKSDRHGLGHPRRLWIAENFTYSDITQKFDLGLRDRVVILEDSDADGRADRRTVFTDLVQRLTSVELGFGGAWLLCPPQLLFVPDRDGDDVPDGPAQVVLDGFTVATENHHTFANGLRWGPDGWLYGRCGASSPGEIGTPGTPATGRIPVRGGLWRYHPGRKRFEVLAHGTTNPWGHDWNALGEAFFINTVNGHLWHVIPGRAPGPTAFDRTQPAGVRSHRPARRPLSLGQLAAIQEVLDTRQSRRQPRRWPRP